MKIYNTLTNYARGMAQELTSATADFIAPEVPVGTTVGQYKSFDDGNAFQVLETQRALGGDAKRIEFQTTDPTWTGVDYRVQGVTASLSNNNARAHYAQGADKYKKGVTSDLFRQNRLGDSRIPDSAVMDSYFTSGKGGVERAQEFKRVFGNNSDAVSAMEDHITSKVALMARGDGTIDPNVVRKFNQRYKEVLKEFPNARRKINQYLEARKVTDDVMKQTAAQRDVAEKEIAKLYLDTAPERVINNVMAGRNPEQKLTQVIKTIGNNTEARNGLRRAFMDWMGKKITSKSQGLAGESFLMPNQMRAFVNNNRKIMSRLYTKSEMKTIDDVLDMASIVQRDVRDIFPGGSDTAAKMQQGAISMSSLMSRLYSLERGIVSKRWFVSDLGARIGHHYFGAKNEAAARKALREAMVNPEFARRLMAKVGTPEGREAAKVINAFLMSSLVNEPADQQEEP